ncbi:MAG: hypothetical protein HYZ53_03795 [Planctomycetes bacterium]|nr:hypothetical protein [Planctomycetota bacterium]
MTAPGERESAAERGGLSSESSPSGSWRRHWKRGLLLVLGILLVVGYGVLIGVAAYYRRCPGCLLRGEKWDMPPLTDPPTPLHRPCPTCGLSYVWYQHAQCPPCAKETWTCRFCARSMFILR